MQTSWDLLCARMHAGLRGDIMLTLYSDENSHFSDFLSVVQPMPHLKQLTFSDGGDFTHVSDANCLEHVPRVFPGMKVVVVWVRAITDESLLALLPCDNLQLLAMEFCKRVTALDVGLMSLRLPLLRHLYFNQCPEIDAATDDHMNKLFQLHGVHARVALRAYELW